MARIDISSKDEASDEMQSPGFEDRRHRSGCAYRANACLGHVRGAGAARRSDDQSDDSDRRVFVARGRQYEKDRASATLTHRVHLNDVPQVVPPASPGVAGWRYDAAGMATGLVSATGTPVNFVAGTRVGSVQIELTRYAVYYFSVPGDDRQQAEINCFSGTGVRVGIISSTLTTRHVRRTRTRSCGLYLHYALSHFADIMTLSKEEKPLYLNLDPSTKSGYVERGIEATGEQEGT